MVLELVCYCKYYSICNITQQNKGKYCLFYQTIGNNLFIFLNKALHDL